MTDKEMQQKILNICKESTENNPIVIFNRIVKNEDISIPVHGPIHHVVDGAAFLTAFFNAGGKINLEESFWELCNRAEKMPGGMCGHWGVCGAVTSVGSALSIIKKSGPLSEFDWGNHILYSSKALEKLGKVGGPRCCKRNGYLALESAIDFVNENINHFGIVLEKDKIECSFSSKNQQCIKERCPFFGGKVTKNNPTKKKIAFICVHNSCRSQIAESLAKHFRGDEFDFYSAGTETKPQINQDAVRLVKKLYGIDMEQTQYSKLISDIPSVDVAISMGCNVTCPYIGKDFDDNWQLDDPTGKSDEEFIKVINIIEEKVRSLK